MKYLAHIPTEQYGFIAVECETAEEAIEQYALIKRAYQNQGLPQKEWNALLDEYLATGTVKNGGDIWENLSEFQRGVCQEIKKSIKRTNT